MKITETELAGVLLIKPKVFQDTRGFFLETWQQARYADNGLAVSFVQDNLSYSQRGVLRGLHFQNPHTQGKLVYVLQGEVFDVAVDVRLGSPTFGRWVGVTLSGDNKHQFWIPEGFAHGFCVLSETALFAYKCTDYYEPQAEQGVIWNDPDLGIDWPIDTPLLSGKDRVYPRLKDIAKDRLPLWQGKN